MLKDKLNEALEAANSEGETDIAAALADLVVLLGDGGVATPLSGGGGHGDPDKK